MEEAEEEEETEAAARGLSVETYGDFAARIAAGAEAKADALGMTLEEYEEHAWSVVAEAQKRDWAGDADISAASDDDGEHYAPEDLVEGGAADESLKREFGLSKADEAARMRPVVEYDEDAEGAEGGGAHTTDTT
jgi:hypothetical protein